MGALRQERVLYRADRPVKVLLLAWKAAQSKVIQSNMKLLVIIV